MQDEKKGLSIELPQSYSVGTTTSSQTASIFFGGLTPTQDHPFSGDPVPPLKTVGYEAAMFFKTVEILFNQPDRLSELVFRNAFVEDAILHARQLCTVFLGPQDKDEITLSHLVPDLDTDPMKYQALREKRKILRKAYDRDGENSYRKAFNQFVMHPTKLRGEGGAYEKPLRELKPLLQDFIDELERHTGI